MGTNPHEGAVGEGEDVHGLEGVEDGRGQLRHPCGQRNDAEEKKGRVAKQVRVEVWLAAEVLPPGSKWPITREGWGWGWEVPAGSKWRPLTSLA